MKKTESGSAWKTWSGSFFCVISGREDLFLPLASGSYFLLLKNLAHIRHRIAHGKCHGFSVMNQMIGFSVCSLFKKVREKEGRGSSLRSKNNSAYALIHESFDLFHFSRQHGEIGIGCNCQYAFLLRGMENDLLSVVCSAGSDAGACTVFSTGAAVLPGDAGSIGAAGSCDFAAGDGDIIAITVLASANTSPIISAGGDQFTVAAIKIGPADEGTGE